MFRNLEDLIETLNTDYFQLFHISSSLKRVTEEGKGLKVTETNLKQRIKEKEQALLNHLQKKYEKLQAN
jgi:regulator of replication initiation timing